jgi:hypothetical protein
MWMHEHFNLNEAPDLVTYSKKMLAGGIYHKVMHTLIKLLGHFFFRRTLLHFNENCTVDIHI